MADNLVVVVMVLAPLAVGMWLVLPAFEALFVPSSYHGPFRAHFAALLPAFVALGLFQAGLNPALLVAKRTQPAILAAGVALAVNLVVLAVFIPRAGGVVYGLAQSAGFVAALVITAIVAWRMVRARPSARDLALVALGVALMTAALLPLRGAMSPWLEAPAMVALGGAIYAGLMWAANVAGCRGALAALRAIRAPEPGETV
jgi:O-antigen/teichoic acid export membrane protein